MKEMLCREMGADIRQLESEVQIKRIFNGMSQTLSLLGHPQNQAAYGCPCPYFKHVSVSVYSLYKEKLTPQLTFNVVQRPCFCCLKELWHRN